MIFFRRSRMNAVCAICTVSLFCISLYIISIWQRTSFSTASSDTTDVPFPSSLDEDSTKTIDLRASWKSQADEDEWYKAERRSLETQRYVKDYCAKHGRNLTVPGLRRFFVVDSPPLLYCLMPKVASRRWRGLLLKMGGREQLISKKFNDTDVKNYFRGSFKFTFVREPFERLLSAYKDKFIDRRDFDRPLLQNYGTRILKHFRPNVTQQSLEALDDITFPEFVEYIIKEGVYEGFNIHWNTYEEQCTPCIINYDFIGRYEFLIEDGRYMLEKSGVDNVQLNEKPFDTRAELLSYYSKIPLEWILQLGRIYHSNFEMFGYPFPGPLEPLFANATHSRAPEDRKAHISF